jgi:Concanavalin A-like lectin/glucanases superfamily
VRASALIVSLLAVGCELTVDTSNLSGGAPRDAGEAAAVADAPTDGVGTPDTGAVGGGDPSLVADWSFDEGAGTKARDATGRGHDGSLVGATWTGGHRGSALAFNGASLVSVAASPDFDRPTNASFTIAAWVRRDGAFSHSLVLSVAYGASSAAYGLEAQGDTLLNYWDGVSHVATATVSFGAGEWHHVAVVVTSGIAAADYFDGKRVATGVADGAARTCSAVTLGSSNYGDHLTGAIDALRFYRRALSDVEIVDEMNR